MTSVTYHLLQAIGNSGLADGIVQAEKADELTIRKMFGLMLVISAALFVVQYLAARHVALYFNRPEVELLAKVQAVFFLLLPWIAIPQALMTRELEFRSRAIVEFIAALFQITTCLILAYAGYGVWALVLAQAANSLILVVGYNYFHRVRGLPSLNWTGVGPLLRFGGYSTLTMLIWTLYLEMSSIVGGRMLTAEELGVFATAASLATIPMQKLMPILFQVAFPVFSRMLDRQDQLRLYFRKAYRLMGLVAYPIFAGVAAVASIFVPLVLGEKWRPIILPMQLLCIAVPFRLSLYALAPAVRALGRPDVSFWNAITTLVFLTPALVVGANWGATGMACGWMVITPISYILGLRRSCQVMNLSWHQLLHDVWPPCLLSVGMYVVVWGLQNVLPATWPSVLSLGILIVVGIAVYIASLRLIFVSRLEEAVSIWRNRRQG